MKKPAKSEPVTYFLHAGDGVEVIPASFRPGIDKLVLDSGTGVYDGILPPLGPLYDGETFSNSHGTASFSVSFVDYNHDGTLDTMVSMGSDAFVVLSHTDLQAYSVFGG